MSAEYATPSRITIGRDRAEAALEFAPAAGKGKARAAAARRLASVYRVETRHPYRTLHYNPASSDAPLPAPDELRLDVSGAPERVARFLSAVPRYLARVEALATQAARVYGRWARSAAAEEVLEYVDAAGRRAYARRFRAAAFAAVADCLGISCLPPYVRPDAPMWDQAARVAWDVVRAAGPVSLYRMHDEAEVAELLAAADRVSDPYAAAHDREAAELLAAELRRAERLSAVLDGEELPATEAPTEDIAEGQEEEELPAVELPAVELTAVQRRWLHTAAAHPEGLLPEAVNLRTLRVLGAAGLVDWTRTSTNTEPVAEAVWKPRAGEVRITPAGRRRAAAEERERVVIVACGGRKATFTDGIRKGQPVIGARAGDLYVGSYHRAMRRAADVLTRGGRSGRVLILSAKYGLVELDKHLLNYDLRAGAPGTVDGETLRRQAHELGISGAAVTVLGGRAYVELAGEVWEELAAPLAGTRGIGEQLARLASIYDPTRAAVEAAVEDRAQEDEELLDSPAAPVRPVELGPAVGARPLSRPLSRRRTTVLVTTGATCEDSPDSPARQTARQGRGNKRTGVCPPNRWLAARQSATGLGVGHGGRVRRPVIALAAGLAVLTTGCVAVAPADGRPAPRVHPDASAVPAPARVTQAPAREELARTDPVPSPSAGPRRRPVPQMVRTPRPPVPAPAVRPSGPPPAPHRTHRPPVPLPPQRTERRSPSHAPATPSYSMQDVCRSAQGVTDPSLVALCRSLYGS
ncbi:DUF6884 domain-containing protein [Streptomyces sp. NPDC053541]|uniref:DUF6884 domain-containing protein n=1 Tax=Streptomyces sp. NPDC053541 TaxID=3365709 RepID=UPI0037D8C3A2